MIGQGTDRHYIEALHKRRDRCVAAAEKDAAELGLNGEPALRHAIKSLALVIAMTDLSNDPSLIGDYTE